MNIQLVFRLLGKLLLTESALMAPSLAVSLLYHEGSAMAFLITMLITALCGALPVLLLKPKRQDLTARDGMMVAGLSWTVLSFFGCLPFLLSGAIPRLDDAFFETVSGFTTTGATILSEIESLPRGILFWRSFTHWIGGMGVLVLTLAVLPKMTGRSAHLARAESAGPVFSKLLPRMSDTAKILYGIYIALSLLMLGALLLCGMNGYDALIHTFGTAGTGGFSNYNASIAAFESPLIEWVIAGFMLLFGVNFAVYFHLVRKEAGLALKNEELWVYGAIVLLATFTIGLAILPNYASFGDALRTGFFQVTSIMSTTGFATADFNVWPVFVRSLLILLMFVGGCAGSTAGGLKLSRLLLIIKAGFRSVHHMLQPRKVSVVRVDGKTIAEETLSTLGCYIFLYFLFLFFGMLAVSFDSLDFSTAFSASLTCINNVGPGLNAVGPTENFSFYSSFSKMVLSFQMLLGRLEIYPVLALFSIRSWKK